jgi:hypothetical protein
MIMSPGHNLAAADGDLGSIRSTNIPHRWACAARLVTAGFASVIRMRRQL